MTATTAATTAAIGLLWASVERAPIDKKRENSRAPSELLRVPCASLPIPAKAPRHHHGPREALAKESFAREGPSRRRCSALPLDARGERESTSSPFRLPSFFLLLTSTSTSTSLQLSSSSSASRSPSEPARSSPPSAPPPRTSRT